MRACKAVTYLLVSAYLEERQWDQESGRDWRRADGPRHCVRPLSLLEVSTDEQICDRLAHGNGGDETE
jgi:hypothetical protein